MSGDDLGAKVRGLAADISGYDDRIEAVEGTAEDLKTRLGEESVRIDQVKADLAQAADRDEVAALAGQVAEAEQTLQAINDSLGRMQQTIAATVAAPGPGSSSGSGGDEADEVPGVAFESWLDTDTARSKEFIAEAVDWAKTAGPCLHPRLKIGVRCWVAHPVVVQALHDARIAWEKVYREDGGLHDLTSWYKLWPELVALIDQDLKGCQEPDEKTGGTTHRDRAPYEGPGRDKWSIDKQVELELEQVAQNWAARKIGRPSRPGAKTPVAQAEPDDNSEDASDGNGDDTTD